MWLLFITGVLGALTEEQVRQAQENAERRHDQVMTSARDAEKQLLQAEEELRQLEESLAISNNENQSKSVPTTTSTTDSTGQTTSEDTTDEDSNKAIAPAPASESDSAFTLSISSLIWITTMLII